MKLMSEILMFMLGNGDNDVIMLGVVFYEVFFF